jgi:hypothetical protein
MKVASSFLFDLVHSLSKSEKRYIKVQQKKGEKDYLKLMDAILLEPYFDENLFILKQKGANFLKNLAVNKRYLYELVLQALDKFGEKSSENQVFEIYSACLVLIDKGLFKAAYKELNKGILLAEKYELFELQIMLLSLEKRMQSSQANKENANRPNSEKIYLKEKYCLEQLANTNEYWYINNQLSQYQVQFQKIQTAEQNELIQSIVKSPKFNQERLASNYKSRLFYYQANSTYYFMKGEANKAHENNKQFLDFLESKPQFLKLYAERYLATLNNLLIDSFILGKEDVLKEGLDRLENLLNRSEFKTIKNLASRVFRQKYLLLLNWSIRQGAFNEALAWIPTIENGLEAFGKTIEKHHRITFYYLSAYILFITEKYDEALKWNNKIMNDPKEDVVKEIFYFSRVLHVLIHFELSNYDLMDSLLLSTPKYLKSRRELYKSEKSLFSLLKKIRNSVSESDKQVHYMNFNAELDKLQKDPKENRAFSFIDLKLWVSSRLK